MLRITIHHDGTLCQLKLAGRLCGPWVEETELAWRSSPCPGEQIEVDMRELTGIDEQGRKLLSAMHRAGARLVVEGVWMTAVAEEITGQQPISPNGALAEKIVRAKKTVPAEQRS